ncbi:sensor histidine kinase [Umezawaea tangerina]|uniref:histidine kinase n=1 Tax=Umezawaea tangerina TaxID=84725 RepID=A0A2T0THI4_9PSEU|nr:histidine kinase [Umezawaea tangerina]PRY45071.1 signal transduction histidine kinase [Umezawaea tangerina]
MLERLRPLADRWRAWNTDVKDGLLALLIAVLPFVPAFDPAGVEFGDLPRHRLDAFGVVLLLAQTLPLVLRTRLPAVCLAVVAVAFSVYQAVGYPSSIAGVGLYLALYAVGAHQPRMRGVLALAATGAYVVLAVVLHVLGSPQELVDFAVLYLVLAVLWLAGWRMRRWRAQEAERRRLTAELATAAERSRIARELHDVVTHHVTAMVVQADAAQFQLDTAPDRVVEGLVSISGTGRRAMTELRYLLGVLEATGESTTRKASLGSPQDLVEQARQSGQPVELTESGDPRPMAVGVELAVYRVVQESLTNALKYAHGKPTAVRVDRGAEWVGIEVTTAGPATAGPGLPSGGRGLSGLRERVTLLGGELTAAGQPDGGFGVRARIPLGSDT